MEYRRLGQTGLKVSRICLGCMSYGDPDAVVPGEGLRWPWALREEESMPFFRRAIELGINFFDTANVYGFGASEVVTGKALKRFARREDVVIATKVYNVMRPGPLGRGLSRKAIFHEMDASLTRLGTDYVDLYQIHRWDYETPIEETMEALHDLVRAGKVRYLGASSMFAYQFIKAQWTARRHGWTPFVAMQNHYNLLYREEEREMNRYCVEEGVGLIPWSPLARGRLARGTSGAKSTRRTESDRYGKMLYAPMAEADARVLAQVEKVASERGVAPASVALAWLLAKPGVTAPIVGATQMEHLEAAVGAVRLSLGPEEIKALEEPYVPHPVAGFS